MLDAVAEFDEQVMEKYLNGHSLSEEEIRRAIRAGTIAMKMTPICADRPLRTRASSSCWMRSSTICRPHWIFPR